MTEAAAAAESVLAIAARGSHELRFDKEAHQFFHGDRELISVNRVLMEAKLVDDKWFTEAARERGTAVHLATLYYDQNVLDPATIHPQIQGYLDAWVKFRLDSGLIPQLMEQPLCDTIYAFGGIGDRFGIMRSSAAPGGIEYVGLDIKTGQFDPITALQLAAYDSCIPISILPARRKRMAVYLHADGTYDVAVFADRNDIQVFRSALQVVNWRRNHKR